MVDNTQDFVNMMLQSAEKKVRTKPQQRTGNVDQKTAEDALKVIRERIQRNR
jgi:hypothetical protein